MFRARLRARKRRSSCSSPSPQASETTADRDQQLEFEVLALVKPCGVSNVRLSGQALAQEWDGVEASGSGVITTQSVSGLGIRKLTASWKSSCIFDTVPHDGSNSYGQDVAQVLTFTVDQVDGKDIGAGSGFTVSFKQIIPEVLRISLVPVPSAGEAESAEEWRNPPPALRWSSLTPERKGSSTLATIEDEVTQLRQLKAEAKEVNRLIKDKKKTIKALIKQDYESFKAEIRQCDNIRCVIKAMLHKARGAMRVACQRFKHGKHGHGHHHHHQQHASLPQTSTDAPSSSSPNDQGSSASHPHLRPHFLPHELEDEHYHSPLHRILKALKLCAILLGIVSFFGFILRRCRNPRRRAEYAARREERRTRRLYRRAAYRQRWRDWFCRRQPRSGPSPGPYDEKRALIIQQESILETAMQAEIRELRNAHEVVNDMVRAEEGRFIHELDGGITGVRPRTLSLPDYDSRSESGSTEPPTYEEQMEGASVVDGFQYTPEGTRSTPASSVVDTSPRISLDSRETRDFV